MVREHKALGFMPHDMRATAACDVRRGSEGTHPLVNVHNGVEVKVINRG